jgi:hypothetical protein
MRCWTKAILILALAALAAQQASGSSDAARTDPILGPLQQGQPIVVKMHSGLGKAVKGVFLASGPDGVRVRQKDGAEMTVPWESVRKIAPKRSWRELLIGVATGAAIAGLAVLSSEGDVGAGWSAGIVGIGAGGGAAAAAFGGPIEGPIYEAPEQETTPLPEAGQDP